MDVIDEFVRELNRGKNQQGRTTILRFGTVYAVTGSTLTVTIGEDEVTGVSRLASVSATVGDKVAFLSSGGDLLVIGVVE